MVKEIENVCIIMAAYNAEKTITAAIRSVIDQTYPYWELIVIDDCSTDATVSIVKSISVVEPRIHLLRNRINRGVSQSRKRGLEYAKSKWIAILDSDDVWTPDKLKKQIEFAEEKSADLIFTGSFFMDDGGNRLEWFLQIPPTLSYQKLLKQNLISNSSVLVNKELYKKYYVMGNEIHEDFAIWLEITKAGHVAYGINEPLLVYRLTKSSKTRNKLKAAQMNWNTYKYIGLNPMVSAYYMFWYTINGLLKYRHLK